MGQFDPFGNDDEQWDWMNNFNPNSSLLANAWNIGKGFAESSGFDLGVFGAFEPSGNLMTNAWRAANWLDRNPDADWAGDFPELFGQLGQEAGETLSDIGSAVGEAWSGFTESVGSALNAAEGQLENLIGLDQLFAPIDFESIPSIFESQEPLPSMEDLVSETMNDAALETGAGGLASELSTTDASLTELGEAGALGAASGDIVATEAEGLAATGADLAGAEILSGSAEMTGAADLIALALL